MEDNKQSSLKKKESNLNRIIILGETTNENINDVIKIILDINEEDNKKKTKKPIKLIINSPGGDLYSALGLVDVILHSDTPIHTICYGHAMSAGFLIFVCGHKRYSGTFSTFMYHDAWYGIDANAKTHEREIIENKRIIELMNNIIVEHTSLTYEMLNEIRERHENKYFTIKEALDLNIVDSII